MTKPGNSGSEEPKQAEQAPEPETTADSAAEPGAETTAESAGAAAAETKPAGKARPVEDAEPLMAELENAPPPPREEAIRAQATRRLDEPPPRTLRFSFYFFAASGLVWLVSAIIFLINKQVIIDAQVESNDRRDITAEQIASAVNQLLWFYLVIALVFAVFLSLFGWKATEGTRRARTLVTIFSAIMLIFHLLLFSTQFGVLSALLALIGLALLWSPSARACFPSKRQLS